MPGRALNLPTARVFQPLLKPARYKGAYGGRGSGKSHFFAEALIEDHLRYPGLRSVCVREVQRTLAESAKRLIEDKLADHGLGPAQGFIVGREQITAPGRGVIVFEGMADHTADSIKSLERFGRAWVEEAQMLSARSASLLRPTIREPNSELWFSWNPTRRSDAVDKMLRGPELPTGAVVVPANWSDNPWFPDVLEAERLDCLRQTPDQYPHIWEGDYATVLEGAYYAKALAEARQEGRIGRVAADPLLQMRAFVDIGGTGAKADAFAIWVAQFVGREIRVLDYYEAQGQPLGAHLEWMRGKGYTPARCSIWLPHDGASQDRVYSVSYESALKQSGYDVTVVPNQGRGAAAGRIEAMRRHFPAMWFNEATTEAGLSALGWYHERRDAHRGIGLGPDHDWSSHAADAAGLMAVAYEAPEAGKPKPLRYPEMGIV